jgi:hypothetical protein
MCPVHHPGRDGRSAQERLRLTTFRLKVFIWVSGAEGDPQEGFGFASDFSSSGVGVYLGQRIAPASSVRLAFESAVSTTYKGVVMWANRFSLRQQFIGHESLSYRMGLRFQFGSEAERRRYLDYREEVKQRILQLKPGITY